MTMERYQEIVGAGWAFPLHVNGAGGIALARGENDIEQAIRIILGTAKGERRMRPNFGCAIHDLVFAPNDESLELEGCSEAQPPARMSVIIARKM